MRFIRQLLCSHDWTHVCNIHGDMILEYGYKRSVWKCNKCNARKERPEPYFGH